MKFSLKIEIELSKKEIDFLKSGFLENKEKKYNILLLDLESTSCIKELSDKGIVKIDHLSNFNLTSVGKLILDQLDRDKKISQILNE